MTPDYTKVHRRFKLEGFYYNREDLMEVAYSFVKEGLPYQQDLGLFLLDWLDKKDYVEVRTSGSTGKPKNLKIKKQAMVSSAITTGDFFNLEPGRKVLSCLPSNFIAGKMMIVRAVVLGLELDMVEPSALPRIDYEKKYDFCAFTPMQLKNFAQYLRSIKTVIVGGGRVSNHIKSLIQDKKPQVYETYGMTETVSHIAVRKLNNFSGDASENLFNVLPNISISQDERGCLVIEAPKLSDTKKIVTNDIVKIYSETEFDWLGRFDNVINTGGVKVYPEQIEEKLQDDIPEQFFIDKIEDDTLGEKVIMAIEGTERTLDNALFDKLDKFEKPKAIFFIKNFKETASGKIHRSKTIKALMQGK